MAVLATILKKRIMKIKWGALVVDGRGKLGGHVASQNKGGSYLRTKVTPSNPQTTFQTSVRALFGSISQAWSGLGASVIAAWNASVDEWKETNIFGDLKQPSGKALFQRLNNQAQAAGYAAVTSPPAKLAMVEGVITQFNIDLADDEIFNVGSYAGADARVVLYATAPVSEGTSFVKNRLRQVYSTLGNAIVPADAYSAYVARFGEPLVTDKIFLGVKYVLPTGQASPLQTGIASIVA